jgi:hypothetical protein
MDTAFTLTASPGGENASRISGFTFDVTDGYYGIALLCAEGEGCAQGWRVDHNEFVNNSGSSKEMVYGYGNTSCFPYGLVDNNVIHDGRMLIYGEAYDTGGNARWAEPLDIGTDKSLYVEDNTFYTTAYNAGYVNWIDGNVGSRYVFRFNTAFNAWTETHSVQGDDHRAQRLWEIYNNTMTCNDTGNCWMPMRMRGGTGVVFNNVASGYNSDYIYLDNVRSCFDYAENWGMCDGGSWIDGNEPGGSGYLCRDQPGASTDAFLWDFKSPPPAQQKTPMYAWNNNGAGGAEMPFEVLDFCAANLLHIQEDREYFNATSAFDGTSGVGVGILADRPSGCIAGAGYWAIDQGTWNQKGEDGVLYTCSASGTWQKYYEPLTYPHPLRNEGTEESLYLPAVNNSPFSNRLGSSPAWKSGFSQFNTSSILLQNFDAPGVPLNKAGDTYPSGYEGGSEGGQHVFSINTADAVSGSSLQATLLSGAGFYAQFNPYDGVGREFARTYAACGWPPACGDPDSWQFDTYNRFRFWIKPSPYMQPHSSGGQSNMSFGQYVKQVTNADYYSDETGGGHPYNSLNIPVVGTWVQVILDMHPDHWRGEDGGKEWGPSPYPTGEVGEYNYYDTLTRFYLADDGPPLAFPETHLIDEMSFYYEPNLENEIQVYAMAATYVPWDNRIIVTWERHKDENTVAHEVRYAFQDIHIIGWDAALPAPGGIVAPPGWQGYNGMVYDTVQILTAGHALVYIAVKPENSNLFKQIAIPAGAPAPPQGSAYLPFIARPAGP